MAVSQEARITDPPEYEELPALPYAGAGLRIVAGLLDLVFLASIFLIFCSAAGLYLLVQTDWGNESNITDAEGWTAIAIASSFAFFIPLYFITCWWSRGQSLGQMATRIMVTDRDGYHMSGWQAVLRTIVWPLSLLPIGIGLLPMFFDRESRALHDMLSGTIVLELP